MWNFQTSPSLQGKCLELSKKNSRTKISDNQVCLTDLLFMLYCFELRASDMAVQDILFSVAVAVISTVALKVYVMSQWSPDCDIFITINLLGIVQAMALGCPLILQSMWNSCFAGSGKYMSSGLRYLISVTLAPNHVENNYGKSNASIVVSMLLQHLCCLLM